MTSDSVSPYLISSPSNSSSLFMNFSNNKNSTQCGEKRNMDNFQSSAIAKKKRKLSHTKKPKSDDSSTISETLIIKSDVQKFEIGFLDDIQSIIGCRLKNVQNRKALICGCCSKSCIVRKSSTTIIHSIQHSNICDLYFCPKCVICSTLTSDIKNTIQTITNVCNQPNINPCHHCLIQIYCKSKMLFITYIVKGIEMSIVSNICTVITIKYTSVMDNKHNDINTNTLRITSQTIVQCMDSKSDVNSNDTCMPFKFILHPKLENCGLLIDEQSFREEIVNYEMEDEPLLEYLVKYRNMSYIHLRWISYQNIIQKSDEFWNKKKIEKELLLIKKKKIKEIKKQMMNDIDSDSSSISNKKIRSSKRLAKKKHKKKHKKHKLLKKKLRKLESKPKKIDFRLEQRMKDLKRCILRWQKDDRPSKSFYDKNIKHLFYNPTFSRIDHILDHKLIKHKKSYLIKWIGLDYNDITWELESDLISNLNTTMVNDKIKSYTKVITHLKYPPSSPSPMTNGNFSNMIKLKKNMSLKTYQREGVDWLCFNWHQRRSVLLSDEMGLGKTVQTIAFLQYLKSIQNISGPFICCAPLSTLLHWKRECQRFSPNLYAIVYQGSKSARKVIIEHEFYYKKKIKFDLLITSYDMLMSDKKVLSNIDWKVLIIDEAHRIKNRECKLWKCMNSQFTFDYKVLLTGTPIQNNIQEFWSLLNFLDNDYFNDEQSFIAKYSSITKMEQSENLRNFLGSHVLRRLKADVEKELGPRSETIIYIELTHCQKAFYRAIYEKNIKVLQMRTKRLTPLRNVAMALRKVCLHPYLISGAENEELRRNNIKLPPDLQSNGNSDQSLQDRNACMEHLVRVSGKFVLLDKLLIKLRKENHKSLIYSQFTSLLDILEDYLQWKQFEFKRIDGKTSLNMRQQNIDEFSDENSDCFVFLLSTRAGGVGINLIAADTVIIFDSDWNPQNDIQAQSRCHRIGQTKHVSVYRLITRDTYEMYIFETASKKLLLDDIVMHSIHGSIDGAGEKKSVSQSKQELVELLKRSAMTYVNPKFDEENEQKLQKFYEDDIDTILSNAIHIQVDGDSSIIGSSALSKAMFVPKQKKFMIKKIIKKRVLKNKKNNDDVDGDVIDISLSDDEYEEIEEEIIVEEEIKMSDPNFWQKLGFMDDANNVKYTTDIQLDLSVDKSKSKENSFHENGRPIRSKRKLYDLQSIWAEMGSDFDCSMSDNNTQSDSDSDYQQTKEDLHVSDYFTSDDDEKQPKHMSPKKIMIGDTHQTPIDITSMTDDVILQWKKNNIKHTMPVNMIRELAYNELESRSKATTDMLAAAMAVIKPTQQMINSNNPQSLVTSANPYSENFCAVEYLKYQTPLYQVNTINIDNIFERKGELSTTTFIVGEWKWRILVYPYGTCNPTFTLMNNNYMSVFLQYLGRKDFVVNDNERIHAEFRCTVHSTLGPQQNLCQEFQHKFHLADNIFGFDNFIPLSILFRTPYYLFPEQQQSIIAQHDDKQDNQNSDQSVQNKSKKRSMSVLKTELWIFPPLVKKSNEKIVIDLIDSSDEAENEIKTSVDNVKNLVTVYSLLTNNSVQYGISADNTSSATIEVDMNVVNYLENQNMPCLEKVDIKDISESK